MIWWLSQGVNDRNIISYDYDDDGLLVSTGSLTISRDEQNGLITGSSIGRVSDSITYNSFGELERYQARFGGSTVYSVDFGSVKNYAHISERPDIYAF